jgi:hypothetical protein
MAQQMNEHDAQQAARIRAYVANPIRETFTQLEPVIQRRIEETAKQIVEARFQSEQQAWEQQQQQSEIQRLSAEFAPYEGTPWGQKVMANVDDLRAAGLTDPLKLYATARQLAGDPPPISGVATPTTPAPAKPTQAAAAPVAPAAQPTAAPVEGQLPPLPIGYTYTIKDPKGRLISADEASRLQQQSFLDKAARASHSPGTANSPHDVRPPVTQAEMDNFFLDSAS